ncbi:hypothetical protein QBC39DRAFT_431335 [Podospora conica]|nr:hypothetical protein QBC39DRAFT_431335 [Schizothecium conicum]
MYVRSSPETLDERRRALFLFLLLFKLLLSIQAAPAIVQPAAPIVQPIGNQAQSNLPSPAALTIDTTQLLGERNPQPRRRGLVTEITETPYTAPVSEAPVSSPQSRHRDHGDPVHGAGLRSPGLVAVISSPQQPVQYYREPATPDAPSRHADDGTVAWSYVESTPITEIDEVLEEQPLSARSRLVAAVSRVSL